MPHAELENVHHEVWVRVWTNLREKPFTGHFRGWIFQIARNLAIDLRRRRRPESLGETEHATDSRQSSPLERLLDTERRDRLSTCMDRLNPEQAAVVRGKLGGEDYEELCRRLGLGSAQAHKLFFNAKKLLESCLEGRADR